MSLATASAPTVPRWRLVPAWLITAFVLFICLAPSPWVRYLLRGRSERDEGIVRKVPYFDKLIHGGIFAAFAVTWAWATPPTRSTRARVLAATLAMAAGTEAMQAIPILERDADVGDLAADAGGGLVGLGLAAFALPVLRPLGAEDG
jgi:hypothetical protein